VERAFRIAIDTAEAGKAVFMLGNLVHNQQVVERLQSLGVRAVAELSEIPPHTKGTLLISAHGVAPETYQAVKKLNLEVIDTTCPWVKKPQKIAKELAEAGRLVIIFGDKKHPEVKGVMGWAKGGAMVIEKEADLDKLSLDPNQKVGILAQTTQVAQDFDRIVSRLKTLVRDVKEYDTICGATSKRQDAAVTLAGKADLMLVIGDRGSANTQRLAQLCAQTGVETRQIQTLKELNHDWLAGKKKIGVTAGASTPQWVINEVLDALRLGAP
jgi:4-hydroxy-3-methylbut-2-enyl diphosphate reductase